MAQARPLMLERLDDRVVPAFIGLAWPDPEHLTLSFAPDGTDVAGQPSHLLQALDAQMPRAVWQAAVLRAFQSWAIHADMNIGLVADGGQALGISGAPQGDSRFGDIRLAGYPLSSEVIAVASPFDTLSGTWGGDVKLNPSYSFSGDSVYDLFTVMLHEAGHALGLGHSSDPASAMTEDFAGKRSDLAASDIEELQALYGSRTPDVCDAKAPNDTRDSATSIKRVACGDLTTLTDVDWYALKPQGNDSSVTVQLHTAGL